MLRPVRRHTNCSYKRDASFRDTPIAQRFFLRPHPLDRMVHPSPVSQPMKIIEPRAEIQAQESWFAPRE
jgi:hypothetical protein